MRNAKKITRQNGERGAAQIEFLLSSLIAMFLFFWIWEMSMMVYTYAVITNAAKEGVRYGIVHGTDNGNCSGPSAGCADATGANVVSAVRSYAAYSLHDISSITIQANYLDSSSEPPSRIQVKVAYTYVPYIKLPWIAPTLVASAEGRIVY
ncbi:MAG: TadE/TadG family type IV pilus assembly protein [Acidobacteriaceae bacterium]